MISTALFPRIDRQASVRAILVHCETPGLHVAGDATGFGSSIRSHGLGTVSLVCAPTHPHDVIKSFGHYLW